MLHSISASASKLQNCANVFTFSIAKSRYARYLSMSIIASLENMPERVIKVIAIAGSLRKASFNRGLLRSAVEIARESIPHMEIATQEIGHLPFLNTDLEADNKFPQPVEEFRAKVLQADSILFASPEYNYSVTSPLKNAIDWGSRAPNIWADKSAAIMSAGGAFGPLKNAIDWGSRAPNIWADKSAAIMSAGGAFGGGRAQYHLRQIGIYIDLHFINKPELHIRAFEHPAKFDGDGNLVDNDTRERVKELLLSLYAYTVRIQNRVVLS